MPFISTLASGNPHRATCIQRLKHFRQYSRDDYFAHRVGWQVHRGCAPSLIHYFDFIDVVVRQSSQFTVDRERLKPALAGIESSSIDHLHTGIKLSRIQVVPPINRKSVGGLAGELTLQTHRARIDPFQSEIRGSGCACHHVHGVLDRQQVPAFHAHHESPRRQRLGNIGPVFAGTGHAPGFGRRRRVIDTRPWHGDAILIPHRALDRAGRRIFRRQFLRPQRSCERSDEQEGNGQGTTNVRARPIKQSATLLGAEPQVEPGSDSASKGLYFYGKWNRTVY